MVLLGLLGNDDGISCLINSCNSVANHKEWTPCPMYTKYLSQWFIFLSPFFLREPCFSGKLPKDKPFRRDAGDFFAALTLSSGAVRFLVPIKNFCGNTFPLNTMCASGFAFSFYFFLRTEFKALWAAPKIFDSHDAWLMQNVSHVSQIHYHMNWTNMCYVSPAPWWQNVFFFLFCGGVHQRKPFINTIQWEQTCQKPRRHHLYLLKGWSI